MIRLPLAGQSTGLEALPLEVVVAAGEGGCQGNGKLNPAIGDKEGLQCIWTSVWFKFCQPV